MQMTSLPAMLSSVPVAPPQAPVSTPSPSTPEANATKPSAHPFADMLRQRQAANPMIEKAAADKPAAESATAEPVSNIDAPEPTVTAKSPANARMKRATDPSTPVKGEHPGDAIKPDTTAADSIDKDAKDARDTKDATGLPVVAHAPEPVQCPIDTNLAAIARKPGSATDKNDDNTIDGTDAKAKAAGWGADAKGVDADVASRAASAKVDAATSAPRTAQRADVSGESLEVARHVVLDDRSGRVDAPLAAPTSFANTLAQLQGSATAAPVDVALATPLNAPEFAQALGTQVSMLVADGVQRAELHLNPADMGPVSIEITLNGTQAQVDFGADLATTRHAIEAGLPELASALQDAGFTLHGGGVSQHSAKQSESGQGRGENGFGGNAREAAPGTASLVAAPARPRVVMTGGVDVYA